MRVPRIRSPRYIVREQLISYHGGVLAPAYFGPGSRRECERRREQLNAKPLPHGFTTRDVTLHRLFSLFDAGLTFKRGGIVPKVES